MNINFGFLFGSLLALFQLSCFGQSAENRLKYLNELCSDLKKYYFSSDISKDMCSCLLNNYLANKYDSTLNSFEFAYEITKDLRFISNDRHILVESINRYNDLDRDFSLGKYDNMSARRKERKYYYYSNQIKKVSENYQDSINSDKIIFGDVFKLSNGIGYMEVIGFSDNLNIKSRYFKYESIKKAFGFLCNADNLIIDLRNCNGGALRLASKFYSTVVDSTNAYFVTAKTFYRFSNSENIDTVVSKDYFGNRANDKFNNKGKKIFFLVSHRTFSSAELVLYKLKINYPDVQIIGDIDVKLNDSLSAVSGTIISNYYKAVIPNSVIINKAAPNHVFNYHLIPDYFIHETKALDYLLEKLGSSTSVNEINKQSLFKKRRLRIKSNYIPIDSTIIGSYRKAKVFVEKNKYYLLYDDLIKVELTESGENVFESSRFKNIKFNRLNDSSIQIEIHHWDGTFEKFNKEKNVKIDN
jgi:hypothetical protein